MTKLTVQRIFQTFYEAYQARYPPTPTQAKAVWSILNCKTAAMGVNASVCEGCGHVHIHYNACRNRCCPMCQELPTQKWIDARQEDVLEAPYYHLVFTLPDTLNPVIYSNQRLLYHNLYTAAAETIQQLTAQPKFLGAKVGFISVLHTWGSAMRYHPHLHVIVLGGGLTAKQQWRETDGDFFLPIPVVSKVFRGKFLQQLKRYWLTNQLAFYGSATPYQNEARFQALLDDCYQKEWVPYCKPTFNGAQAVIHYLGKYTHRIAISNQRLIRMDEHSVTFSVKDYTNDGAWKEETVSGIEFIRRFLMHIPPQRFVRIRHYGLLANRCKKKLLAHCRILLGCRQYRSRLKDLDTPQILKLLYNIDPFVCQVCGKKLTRLTTYRMEGSLM